MSLFSRPFTAMFLTATTHGHFCTLPSFARVKRLRWRPVELNDRHLRSHGKIGDCKQSKVRVDGALIDLSRNSKNNGAESRSGWAKIQQMYENVHPNLPLECGKGLLGCDSCFALIHLPSLNNQTATAIPTRTPTAKIPPTTLREIVRVAVP